GVLAGAAEIDPEQSGFTLILRAAIGLELALTPVGLEVAGQHQVAIGIAPDQFATASVAVLLFVAKVECAIECQSVDVAGRLQPQTDARLVFVPEQSGHFAGVRTAVASEADDVGHDGLALHVDARSAAADHFDRGHTGDRDSTQYILQQYRLRRRTLA